MNDRREFIKKTSFGGLGLLVFPEVWNTIVQNFKNEHFVNDSVFPFYDFIKTYNFGDYIPKDQGGKFVQMEILNTESDVEIVQKIKSGVLNDLYGNPIRWDALEKTELEKSVWLNRFYFLPSFARMYYLTKDNTYAEEMFYYLNLWIEDNPYISGKSDKTYNWRDMQAAWRAINWSWCYYLTLDGLSAEQKTQLTNSLMLHGEVLLNGFGEQPLNEFNHQAHGALAMLYLGVLFPEWEIAEKLRTKAWLILEHHLQNAFLPDGGNVETMFGYYPFETHIFRDFLLLNIHNNYPIPSTLKSMLEKMANYISYVSQPDDTMPPINDSYPVNTTDILQTIKDVGKIQIGSQDNVFHLFPDTQIGILKKTEKEHSWYSLLYPAKRIGAHAHAGRLSFILWKNKRPIITESGCVNYDNPLLVEWFRTSQAHNTLLIDGKGDIEASGNDLWLKKRITNNQITEWKEEKDFLFCQMNSPASETSNFGVNWYRNIALVKNKIFIIYDYLDSDKPHVYQFLFHFPQIPVYKIGNHISIYDDDSQCIIPSCDKTFESIELQEGIISENGLPVKAPMAKYTVKGKGTVHSVLLLYSQNEMGKNIKVKQKNYPDGMYLVIKSSFGVWKIAIKNPSSSSFSINGYKTSLPFDFREV